MTVRVALIVALATIAGGAIDSNAQLRDRRHWVGTWATAAQPARPGAARVFHNQTIRLIAHTSIGGRTLRMRLSNTYGDEAIAISSAHVARRARGADIEAASDRAVLFAGKPMVNIPPRSMVISDPIDIEVAALSDVAVSLFFPQRAVAATVHSLALQTSYASGEVGDVTGAATFPVATRMSVWPILTGIDVEATAQSAAIVAFGSSTTDGDGSTTDANRRWPDVLAERLQHEGGHAAELGVLNEGIIGNRLLFDSPKNPANPFGAALGEAGTSRFERDVLDQSGVRYVFICLGVNDMLFPEFPFNAPHDRPTADDIIAGYRQLIARAHAKNIRVVGTTIPPFEGATFTAAGLDLRFYTADREQMRAAVNEWIRHGGQFDDVADFDAAVRDPDRPTQLLPAYAADDHLHVNDAGNVAQANAVPLSIFSRR